MHGSTVPDSSERPHPARLDGEGDGELDLQHPTTPPILPALPPKAAMREEWVRFGWRPLALHLLHQRRKAVGVGSGTVELRFFHACSVLAVSCLRLSVSIAAETETGRVADFGHGLNQPESSSNGWTNPCRTAQNTGIPCWLSSDRVFLCSVVSLCILSHQAR